MREAYWHRRSYASRVEQEHPNKRKILDAFSACGTTFDSGRSFEILMGGDGVFGVGDLDASKRRRTAAKEAGIERLGRLLGD